MRLSGALASCLLLVAALSAGAGDEAPRTASAAFRLAEKKLDAGELDGARRLYQKVANDRRANEGLRRQAFHRLLDLTQRLDLHDQTVEQGLLYRELLTGRADRGRWAEVTLQVGLAYEALAQYALAEKMLQAGRPTMEQHGGVVPRLLLLTRLAHLAGVLHPPEEAQKRWKAAESAALAVLDRPGQKLSPAQHAECVGYLAECWFHQGRHAEAIQRLEKLLASLEEGKERGIEVETLRKLADHQEGLRRFGAAAASLRKALALYANLPVRDRLVEAELNDALGDALGKGRQPAQAEKAREQAVRGYLAVWKGSTRQASPFARSRAFWKMQRLYRRTHQYKQALQQIIRVVEVGKDGPLVVTDPLFKARHASLHVFLGSYGEARGLFREAVKALEAGDPLNLVELPRAINSLAIVEQATDGLAEADRQGLRCIELYRKYRLPDDETLIETWNLLGTNASLQGEFSVGVQRFRTGAALCEKLGPKADRLLSSVLLNHALLHMGQGDFKLATTQLVQARTVYQRSEEPDSLGVALFECAEAHLLAKQGLYAQASRLAERVLVQARKHEIPGGPLVHTAMHWRAMGHLQQREYGLAFELWEKLRKAQEESSEHLLSLPRTLNHLGQLAEIRRQPAEARKLYQRASDLQEKQTRTIPIPTTRFVTLWRLATLLDRDGDHAGARATLMRAIEMVEAVRQQTYGDAEQRTTFLAGFVPGFEQAVDWAVKDGRLEDAFNLASRFRSRAFLDQLLLAGADPRASLTGKEGAALRQREKEVQKRLARLRAQLTLIPAEAHARDRAVRLIKDLRAAQKDFADVWRDILDASPLYRVLADEALLTRPLAVLRKKVLTPRTALLSYHLQRRKAYALLVTPGKQTPEKFDLAVSADLVADLQRLLPSASAWGEDKARRGVAFERRKVIGTDPAAARITGGAPSVPLSQPLAALLVEHYRCLLEDRRFGTRGVKLVNDPTVRKAVTGLPAYAEALLPAALRQRLKELAPESVIVVPDGPLHKLPLEALLLRTEPRPTFALDELPPLVYAPSVSSLAYLADRPAVKGSRSLLTVCDPAYPKPFQARRGDGLRLPPVFTGEWARLPFTADESKRIRRLFPSGSKVTVLKDKDATKEQVVREIGRHSIVHIAAHGFADEHVGNRFGALALTRPEGKGSEGDGFLELHEIYRLPLGGCELAVLSACETNVGPQLPLEAGVTLASGFLSAGARRVVASHWSVDDRSTAELMAAFFEEITSKSAPSYAVALYRARKRLRDRAETESPFQWAPFVLIGAGR